MKQRQQNNKTEEKLKLKTQQKDVLPDSLNTLHWELHRAGIYDSAFI